MQIMCFDKTGSLFISVETDVMHVYEYVECKSHCTTKYTVLTLLTVSDTWHAFYCLFPHHIGGKGN